MIGTPLQAIKFATMMGNDQPYLAVEFLHDWIDKNEEAGQWTIKLSTVGTFAEYCEAHPDHTTVLDAHTDYIQEAYMDACDVDGFSPKAFVSGLHSSGLNIVSFLTGADNPEVPLVPDEADPVTRLRGCLEAVTSSYAMKVLTPKMLSGLLAQAGLKLTVAERDRGDGRKAHYGTGKQPWDTIREHGWEPEWLAGNIIKYVRRIKDIKHSYESAQIYWRRLSELAEPQNNHGRAFMIRQHLLSELSPVELEIVNKE